MRKERHVCYAHVPMSRDGKITRDLMVIGEVHPTCRIGKGVSIAEVKRQIRSEFMKTGRVVPPWRVQQIADELGAKAFAQALDPEKDLSLR
jgi:hypothetical protein